MTVETRLIVGYDDEGERSITLVIGDTVHCLGPDSAEKLAEMLLKGAVIAKTLPERASALPPSRLKSIKLSDLVKPLRDGGYS